ncbi:ATP phosphoribosyltransferase [Pseudokineococcus sp. 1T1Z-3]|uniref:ATP phosphoribosyltransferase n=1 Tax=Pseudokineococcus sp. 1T1Z-3 TaxID=3132745 RepID=UPI0030B70A63
MLRIAVPNKGALSEPATTLLREAGYAERRTGRELVVRDTANDVELYFLRPRDIALYVGAGTLDAGLTGRDLLLDSGADAEEVLELGFASSTFRFAAPSGQAPADLAGLAGRRVATSYDGLVGAYLAGRGVDAPVVRLDGAVEISVALGVADVIADVVETGSTLRAAGLEVFGEPILQSQAVLVRRRGVDPPAGLDTLVRRVEGVLVAREYVMVDYDVHVDRLDAASALTPGLESPTVSPLRDASYVAVRSMVRRTEVNAVMDGLYDVGARAILVTTIHACRI